MEIDRTGWNVEWVLRQTKDQFIAKVLQQKLYTYLSPEDRIKALENVYELITSSGGKPNPAGEDITEEQV